MVITLGPDLESALQDAAHKQRVAPEVLVFKALRERFLTSAPLPPQDEWELQLLTAATDCGVSLPDAALSREELY